MSKFSNRVSIRGVDPISLLHHLNRKGLPEFCKRMDIVYNRDFTVFDTVESQQYSTLLDWITEHVK